MILIFLLGLPAITSLSVFVFKGATEKGYLTTTFSRKKFAKENKFDFSGICRVILQISAKAIGQEKTENLILQRKVTKTKQYQVRLTNLPIFSYCVG